MASRRPKHGLTEATGRVAIAVPQREPDQRNDDAHVEMTQALPGATIDAYGRETGLTTSLPCVPNCRASWRSSSHE